MPKCKLCGRNRKLVLHNPYYGIHAKKGKRKAKICRACSIILERHGTKKFTDVLQSEVWDRPVVPDGLDAVLRPLRRINYMVRFVGEVTANPESLAEHSYSVLLLATQIAKRVNTGTVDFERLVSMAMFHDVSEIMLGDIPTPLKQRDLKAENSRLEKQALKVFNDDWNIWTGALDEYDYSNVDNVEARIVKCADYMSAIVYCTEEIYIGSHNLEEALKRSLDKFEKFAHHEWEKDLVKRMQKYAKEQLE